MALGQTARVVLRWKAAPGMTGYQLQIAADTGFSQIVLDQKVQEPVLKWESLPSTTFYWRVRSFDLEGRASEWSAPRQIAPATGPPAPRLPADAVTLPCSAEPVALWLETSSVLKEYQLELSPGGAFSPGDTTVLLSKNGEFRTALPAGTISWRGRGVDLTGRTTEPSPARKLTVRLPPPRPKPTADVPVGTPSVTLSWAGSACATRYVVEASHDRLERAVLEAQETSISFKPAGVGEYRFRVAARDDKGNQSDWSPQSAFRVRLPAPLARGERVGAREEAGTPVELWWTAAPQAASYLVELSTSASFKGAAAATVSGLTHPLLLEPGKYLWRVTARDPAGHPSFSSEPRAFVISDAIEPQPVALQFPLDQAILTRPDDGALEVTWVPAGGAVTHELEVDGVAQTVEAPPARLVLSEGDHALRIRALGATSSSPWSPMVRFHFGPAQVVSARPGLQPAQAGGYSPFNLGGVLGGRFNFGAVASPSAALSLGYRPPLAKGRFTAQLRGGIYGAAATLISPDGPLAARVTAPSLSLLVGTHLDFGAWTLLGVIGGGAQLAVSSVGDQSQSTVLPGFELVLAFGRRLGPGAVEVELSFLYSRLNIPLARLQAGGLFAGIGYRFDLSGGK